MESIPMLRSIPVIRHTKDVYDYFQSIGSINEVNSQNSTVQSIVNVIIKDSIQFVMYVTAALMAIIFVLTFRLTDKEIKKPNKKFKKTMRVYLSFTFFFNAILIFISSECSMERT
jgi:hypothetical protein